MLRFADHFSEALVWSGLDCSKKCRATTEPVDLMQRGLRDKMRGRQKDAREDGCAGCHAEHPVDF